MFNFLSKDLASLRFSIESIVISEFAIAKTSEYPPFSAAFSISKKGKLFLSG